MLDVLIRGGWIADGAGSPPYLGDVAIEGGKIADVGRLGAAATADRVIDATGKIVCPGFVDPHSHSDFSILANPTAESTIRQGVTTEVVGNCGWSYAPVTAASEPTIRSRLHSFGFDKPTIPWSTFGEHLEFLSDVGHTPNFAWFVGHNAIRLAAGCPGSTPSAEQMSAMEGFVHEAMQSGALGMSTGLEFNPGREATAEELMRLNAVAGRVRRHLHEPHPQPRLGPARGDRRVPRGRPGGEHESGDLAPERPPQHERARAGLGARGREDGGEP